MACGCGKAKKGKAFSFYKERKPAKKAPKKAPKKHKTKAHTPKRRRSRENAGEPWH
jgi:hypothetical protein